MKTRAVKTVAAMKSETARIAHLTNARKLEARAVIAAVFLMAKSESTFRVYILCIFSKLSSIKSDGGLFRYIYVEVSLTPILPQMAP
jgi:hypothetical protein